MPPLHGGGRPHTQRVTMPGMPSSDEPLPDWERLLAAERHLRTSCPARLSSVGLQPQYTQVIG
jgi:hypothetical protein